jgi:arginase family enzyme
VDRVYLHLDVDAIDAGLGLANGHAARGGLGLEAVRAVVDGLARRIEVAAVAFTAFDPAADPARRFGTTAVEVVRASVAAILTAS